MSLTVHSKTVPEASHQLVWLHGWGANGKDLMPVASSLTLSGWHSYFLEAPLPHPGGGWMWANIDNHAELPASQTLVRQWLEALPEQSGIPLSNTVLVGFSQGGMLSLQVGMSLPLAAVICCSGYLLSPPTVHTPPPALLLLHGREDPIVPPIAARAAASALSKQGVRVSHHELAMGHTIAPEAITLMQSFLEAL